MSETTGDKIKAARESVYLSQDELARKANVTTRTIWAIENGTSEPRLSTLRQVAAALDLHPSELQVKASA